LLINLYAAENDIVAIKITPHFHEQPQDKAKLWQSQDCIIYLEEEITNKDSSLFLQAGAKTVFYIESKDYKNEEAFEFILNYIGEDKLIICESGNLASIYKPGILIFLESTNIADLKTNKFPLREFADWKSVIEYGKLDDELQQILSSIKIEENKWRLV